MASTGTYHDMPRGPGDLEEEVCQIGELIHLPRAMVVENDDEEHAPPLWTWKTMSARPNGRRP